MTAAVEQFHPGVERRMEGQDQAERHTAGAIRRNAWLLALEQAWLLGSKESDAELKKGEDAPPDQRASPASAVRPPSPVPAAMPLVAPAFHGQIDPYPRAMDVDADAAVTLPWSPSSSSLTQRPAQQHGHAQQNVDAIAGRSQVPTQPVRFPVSYRSPGADAIENSSAVDGVQAPLTGGVRQPDVHPEADPAYGKSIAELPAPLSAQSGADGNIVRNAGTTPGNERQVSAKDAPRLQGKTTAIGADPVFVNPGMSSSLFHLSSAMLLQQVGTHGLDLSASALPAASDPVAQRAPASALNPPVPAISPMPRNLNAPGLIAQAGPAAFRHASEDMPESDTHAPSRSQASFAASSTDTEAEPIPLHRLHVYRDQRGVQAWIRDAGLSASQEIAVSSALISTLSLAGESINAVYMNGKPITATLSTRKVRPDNAFNTQLEASGPQDSNNSTITQFAGVSSHGHQ
jgi:hypothetical protein